MAFIKPYFGSSDYDWGTVKARVSITHSHG